MKPDDTDRPVALDALLDADRPEPSADFDARFMARLDAGVDLDALLDADRPEPSPDFDARFTARLAAIGPALDALLDADRPEPSPDFDARLMARLEAGVDLDALLDADRPEPSPDFDARFMARLAEADGEDVDALLDADRPEPSPGFDARVRSRLDAADPPPRASARVLRFVRRPAVIVPLMAAAAALIAFVLSRPAPEPPPAELGLLAHMELLEVYDEMEVLDGIADDETFELVAMLHTLDEEEARP